VFALIGGVFSGVRRWISRLERVPDVDHLVGTLADSVWLQINGMAGMHGIELPPAVPLTELLSVLEQSGS
jgi:hypothetical protein